MAKTITDLDAVITPALTDTVHLSQGGVDKKSTFGAYKDLIETPSEQICKAWVNFNGTGTVAIRDDFNVSSITDIATGNYRINFTNNMDDTNYATVVSTKHAGSSHTVSTPKVVNVAFFEIFVDSVGNLTLQDSSVVSAVVFGAQT